MRQRNDSGSDLNVNDLNRTVFDGEEFDHELLVPGCTEITPLAAPEDDSGADDAPPDITTTARTGRKGAQR